MYSCCFFFFKQKTAYEMRISDWSSDVCSSDLAPGGLQPTADPNRRLPLRATASIDAAGADPAARAPSPDAISPSPASPHPASQAIPSRRVISLAMICSPRRIRADCHSAHVGDRSEEHTTELQSLMRSSHPLYCM